MNFFEEEFAPFLTNNNISYLYRYSSPPFYLSLPTIEIQDNLNLNYILLVFGHKFSILNEQTYIYKHKT